jgi:ABC-type bacteriocin/lantibiotic exporter with double-glycine peptidase domain
MLLLGLYAPSEGKILYDGIPLQDLNYRALRSQFGVVLQEPFLFSGSIRQNIAFSNPGLRLDQIVEAARLAAVHEEIAQMPMGYDTVIAERGSGLSGGQRQRISLARALAHKPAILLLDEATSHLDVVTERLIETNLNKLASTRVVIAHRLSSVRNADRIVVLDNGIVAEEGRHEELLSQDGCYAMLVSTCMNGAAVHMMPSPSYGEVECDLGAGWSTDAAERHGRGADSEAHSPSCSSPPWRAQPVPAHRLADVKATNLHHKVDRR